MCRVAPSAASPAVLVTVIVGATSTTVVSVSESLLGTLSFAEDTVAVFDNTCSVPGDVTAMLIAGAAEFAATDARVHVIVVVPVQVHPEPEAEPLIPPGSASVTLTDDAEAE